MPANHLWPSGLEAATQSSIACVHGPGTDTDRDGSSIAPCSGASCCSSGAAPPSPRSSSGWAGCRPSTRPRCTSASGPGSRASSESSWIAPSSGARVAQGTLMRATIHLVSKADYWPMAIGIRRSRREAWVDARAKRGYTAKQASSAARKLRRRARRRHDEPQGDSRAARLGQRHHQRRQHVARPRSGAAVGHLGSPSGGPLRGGGALAGQTAGQARRGAGHRAAGQALSGRLRSLGGSTRSRTGRVCRPTG